MPILHTWTGMCARSVIFRGGRVTSKLFEEVLNIPGMIHEKRKVSLWKTGVGCMCVLGVVMK